MEKIKICQDCKKEFKITKKTRYERKYCDKCSLQRKKDYENIHNITFDECDEE